MEYLFGVWSVGQPKTKPGIWRHQLRLWKLVMGISPIQREAGLPCGSNYPLIKYLLQQVGLLDGLQHVLLGSLLGLSTQQELIQDEVGLLKVEDNIQLAHLWGHGNRDSSRSEELLTKRLKTLDFCSTIPQHVTCGVWETHTAKIFVQQLHISVDDLQGDQLIILVLDCAAEIQARVSTKSSTAEKDKQGGDEYRY